MDVGGRGTTSRVANDRGVGWCPYPTKVCALTLSDSFLARSFLSQVVDHSFLYHLSFIPLQTCSRLFLIPFPASLEGLFLLSIPRLLKFILN
jgi:hypothetical protein